MIGASDRELEPGDTLGPSQLEAVLGEGEMGLVFKAHRRPATAAAYASLLRAASEEDTHA